MVGFRAVCNGGEGGGKERVGEGGAVFESLKGGGGGDEEEEAAMDPDVDSTRSIKAMLSTSSSPLGSFHVTSSCELPSSRFESSRSFNSGFARRYVFPIIT